MRFTLILSLVLAGILFAGCSESNPVGEMEHEHEHEHGVFEVIEHAAIHMQDATGLPVSATTTLPGPHLDPDSIEHRRIDVTLPAMGSGYGGYIHFGPDVTGDMLVCVDVPVQMSVTNRTGQGDTPIEIERTFTEQEIADSAHTTLVKSAILFEAETGGNIIKFEPVSQQVIHVVIEEAAHEHDH